MPSVPAWRLALALLDAGKQVQVVLSDGLPASFKHLPGSAIDQDQGEKVSST